MALITTFLFVSLQISAQKLQNKHNKFICALTDQLIR